MLGSNCGGHQQYTGALIKYFATIRIQNVRSMYGVWRQFS